MVFSIPWIFKHLVIVTVQFIKTKAGFRIYLFFFFFDKKTNFLRVKPFKDAL